MSFLKPQIPRMESLFGTPHTREYTQKMTISDMSVVTGSMKNGRSHDITLYIRKDDGYIFIAKHFYPKDLYRAPSGGVNPTEDFVDGAKREAMEETGTVIELEKYIMRINVNFESPDINVVWTSHVFTARHLTGEISPQDTDEIREAILIKPDDIHEYIQKMKNSSLGGLNYRAYLTSEVQELLSS